MLQVLKGLLKGSLWQRQDVRYVQPTRLCWNLPFLSELCLAPGRGIQDTVVLQVPF